MSEEAKYIKEESKAWDMAYAEKSHRDAKIGLMNRRKQGFRERLSFIKRLIDDDSADLSLIRANADEEAYDSDGFVTTKGWPGVIGGSTLYGLEGIAEVAKALAEQSDLRSHRVLTENAEEGMQHPDSAKVDVAKKELADSHYEGYVDHYGPGGDRDRTHRGLNQQLKRIVSAKLSDPSRSIAGDKAAEEAAERYEERQRIKEMLAD